jgi:hypothetical protein
VQKLQELQKTSGGRSDRLVYDILCMHRADFDRLMTQMNLGSGEDPSALADPKIIAEHVVRTLSFERVFWRHITG